ncbi:hypothetical protein [Corynebacterium sp.]|uniref:hypothetical protein n=1 Tax=Corynebacterium sp. TaxID=1720 RepID=UPI0026DADAEA|nr:hypothetical protein [Corynebacterium sp.]MDO5076231.1 hypothetical protein [Corynebacterium sp.]
MNDLRLEEARWAPIDIGAVFNKSWSKFTSNPVPWILSSLIYCGIYFVLFAVYMIGVVSVASTSPESGSLYDPAAPPSNSAAPGIGFVLLMGFIIVAMMGTAFVWSANMYRCAALAINGEQLTVRSFFSGEGLGKYFVVNLCVGLVVVLGTFLCILPGFVAAFVLGFVPAAVFTIQQPSVSSTFKASIEMVKRNPGPAILALLMVQVINAVGQMVIVGIVVTLPLTALFTTYALRNSMIGSLTDGPSPAGGPAGGAGFGGSYVGGGFDYPAGPANPAGNPGPAGPADAPGNSAWPPSEQPQSWQDPEPPHSDPPRNT